MSTLVGSFLAGLVFTALGTACAILGVVQFDLLVGLESAGNVRDLGWRIDFFYTHLGKWGVFAVYEVLGMSFLIAAIDKFRTGPRAAA